MRIESTNTYRDYQNNFDGGASASEQGVLSGESAESQDSLSSLLASGDVGAQVAALLIDHAKNQRNASREAELAENAALDRAAEAEVQAMHDKADATRMEGFCTGLTTIGSGVMSYGTGSTDTSSDQADSKFGKSLIDAEGAMGAKYLHGAGEDADSRSRQFKYESEVHQRNAKSAADTAQENQKLLEHAIDFYKQYSQGASEAQKTSIGR